MSTRLAMIAIRMLRMCVFPWDYTFLACCHMVWTLVSWSLTSLFSTNMAISETKGQGWKVIRTQ